MVHISKENSKIGKVWNVSVPPIMTCPKHLPCYKLCYARKAYRLYPQVRQTWRDNFRMFEDNPQLYFHDIICQISSCRKGVPLFRWHVGGDIINQTYLEGIKRVARECPTTRFLVFTKRHNLTFSDIPRNLSIVFSMWVGMPVVPKNVRIAWYQDGTETRIPKDAIKCSGHCETCKMCWDLQEIGKDVYFLKH